MIASPLLTALIVLPLLGAGAVLAAPDTRAALTLARGAATLALALALAAVVTWDPAGPTWQLTHTMPWLPALGAAWRVGLDGLALPMLPLAAGVGLAALVGLDPDRDASPRLQAGALLVQTSALTAIFVATDLALFFAAWELALLPTVLMLGLAGRSAGQEGIAVRVGLTLLIAGMPLLLALVVLAGPGGPPNLDLTSLEAQPLPLVTQRVALGLMLLGLAVKAPLAPFHGWMPDTVAEGPAGLAAGIVGFKTGAWAMLRLGLALCPAALAEVAPALGVIAVLSALYAALHAMRATRLRRTVAWLGVSHVGLVVAGIATLDAAGVQGAVWTLAHFALSGTGLVLLAAWLGRRMGREELPGWAGLAAAAPGFAGWFIAFGLVSVGMPGTSGFVGEVLVLLGVLRTHPWWLLIALPVVPLGAVALGRRLAGMVGGPKSEASAGLRGMEPWEVAPLAGLLVVSIFLGIFPSLGLDRTAARVEGLVAEAQGPEAGVATASNPATTSASLTR